MKKKLRKLCAVLAVMAMAVTMTAGCRTAADNSSEAKQEEQKENAQPIDVNVTALKGPTAMGMVQMMDEVDSKKVDTENYKFTIAASIDEVTPAVAQGKTDIAAVPANVASVLYHKLDGGVQALAVNTLGILYIVEKGDTVQSAADLKGKTIYASGKGATPEYALNYILAQNGLDPSSDVTIEWKSEHAECVAAITQDPTGIAMLPQPFVTTAQSKDPTLRVALDLTDEWDKLQKKEEKQSALLTGVLIVRKEFAREHPEAVADFMERYSESVKYVNDNVKEAAQLVGKYNIVTAEVAEKAIPQCNIVCITKEEMKEKLSGYLSVLADQNPEAVGGKVPDDDFYYTEE